MDASDWQNHFELWSKYEDIAMHFNQLLITLRTQALGGVALAVSAVVGFLAYKREEGQKESANWGAVSCVAGALTAFWFALSILDLGYYAKLLDGAVQGILIAEQQSTRFGPEKTILLSNQINSAVSKTHKRRDYDSIRTQAVEALKRESYPAVPTFYGVVLATLAGATGGSLGLWCIHGKKINSHGKKIVSAMVGGVLSVAISLAAFFGMLSIVGS